MKRTTLAPSVAIVIVVSAQVALGRLLARGRSDDDPAVARERLAIYETETAPALDWLDRRGLVVRVDGQNAHAAVARDVWRGFQHFRRAHDPSSLSLAWAAGSARDTSWFEVVDGGFGDGEVG